MKLEYTVADITLASSLDLAEATSYDLESMVVEKARKKVNKLGTGKKCTFAHPNLQKCISK